MRITINITPDDIQALIMDITQLPKDIPESYNLLQQILFAAKSEAANQQEEIEVINSMLDQNYYIGNPFADKELYEKEEEEN